MEGKLIEAAMREESRKHPWADESVLRRLVEDHLRMDPGFYDELLEGEEYPDDPYPESVEPRLGKKEPGVEIAVVFGKKPKKPVTEDPYPEE